VVFSIDLKLRIIKGRGKIVSVILTGECNQDGTLYEVFCEACKSPVGILTRSELSELSARSIRVMCFACDGVRDDEYPECLIPKEGETIFIFGEERTTVLSCRPRDMVELLAVLARNAFLAPCLSSSPYLSHYERNSQKVEENG